jgi:hypothetical protein
MKTFFKFLVIVFVLVIASATAFAAAPKKDDAKKAVVTETEVVTDSPVIVKVVATKTVIKIKDPKQEKTNVSIAGEQEVEYELSEIKDGIVVNANDETETFGNVKVKSVKKVRQTNTVVGDIEKDYDDNNRPCPVEKKEDWAQILWGDESKKTHLNVRFQIGVGIKTVERLSFISNGIEIFENGDDLALLEIWGQINLNNWLSLAAIRTVGFREQSVEIAGLPIGGLSATETTALIKWYPGEIFQTWPYFGVGGRWIHIDGGYSIGGVPLNVAGDGVIFGTRCGIEIPITSKWLVDVWGEYFPSTLSVTIPGAGKYQTTVSGKGGIGVSRNF